MLAKRLFLLCLLGFTSVVNAQTFTTDAFFIKYMLLQAEISESTSEKPPLNTHWQSIQLPDTWRHSAKEKQRKNAWYRFHPKKPNLSKDSRWGIYLLRANLNVSVWLNGNYLGDGGSFEEPVSRNWNRPLLFNIPKDTWRDNNNTLLIRLRAQEDRGALAPPLLAPIQALQPLYDARFFRQITLSQTFFFITLAIAIFLFTLWLRRPSDKVYLWFALSAFCWSWLNLHLFIRDLPFDATLWWKGAHSAIDFWWAFLTLFTHQLAGIKKPWIDRLAISLATIGAIAYFSADTLDQFVDIFLRWHLIGVIATAYLMLFSGYQAWQQKRTDLLVLSIGLATLFALAAHDWMLTISDDMSLWLHGYHLMPQAAPLIFIAMTWHLTGRFINALNEAEELNTHLENRVENAREKLAKSYAEQQQLEREQAATEERERIYSDLHDDLGAKLLTLVYRAADETTADLARSALQDLRDVVSRNANKPVTLNSLLSDWRSEAQQRLDLAGIQLDWHQNENESSSQAQSSNALAFHLGRILREALSNILKHAEASNVEIRVSINNNVLSIDIHDNGNGCLDASPGRGIQNMHKRIEALKGKLHGPESAPKGCHILIELPLNRTN